MWPSDIGVSARTTWQRRRSFTPRDCLVAGAGGRSAGSHARCRDQRFTGRRCQTPAEARVAVFEAVINFALNL
jgi:hypothetical protein